MDRKKLILATLSCEQDAVYTPVQLQKLFFLVDKKLPDYIGGEQFNFQPYHYGPFDSDVYHELSNLSNEGMVNIIEGYKWNRYALTNEGQSIGEKTFQELDSAAQSLIKKLVRLILSLGFSQLVSAIYKAYPEMRANSVFQG